MSRISYITRFEHPKRILLENTSDMQENMEKISTGKRLSKPSDNPPDMVRSFRFHNQKEQIAQFKDNVNSGKNKLSASESVLDQVTSLTQRVRELGVRAANDSLGAQERNLIASEVNERLEELFDIANSKQADKYLFGGTETEGMDQLFTAKRNGAGEIVNVSYNGDTNPQQKQVGEGEKVKSNLLGNEIFQASNQTITGGLNFANEADVTTDPISDTTGSVNKGHFKIDGEKFYYDTGSDTLQDIADKINSKGISVEARIQGNEDVEGVDTANNEFVVSGDQTDSLSSGDKLVVDGSTGNDGVYTVGSISYDSGPNETTISVEENVDDSTADGTIQGIGDYKPGNVAGSGHDSYQLEIKSRTPHGINMQDVDRDQNTAGVQGLLNDLQFLDGTKKKEQNFPNSYDPNSVIKGKSLFDSIIDLREALQEGVGDADSGIINKNNAQTTRNLDPAKPREQIEQSLEDLQRGLDNVLVHRSVGGARLNRMESAKSRIADQEVHTTEMISEIEDTNLAEVISEYKRQKTVQQASLRMSSNVMQMTLANYI